MPRINRLAPAGVFFVLVSVLAACGGAPETGSTTDEGKGTAAAPVAEPGVTTEGLPPPTCFKGTEACYCGGVFCACVASSKECEFECKGDCQ